MKTWKILPVTAQYVGIYVLKSLVTARRMNKDSGISFPKSKRSATLLIMCHMNYGQKDTTEKIAKNLK